MAVKKNTVPNTEQGTLEVELALEAAAELRRFLRSQPDGAVDLESVETAVKASVMRFGAAVLQSWINADRSDARDSRIRCECGHTARRAGRRSRSLLSAVGELVLWRAYYHCGSCGRGIFPKDRALGIDGHRVSGAVQRMIAKVAAQVSFAATRQLLLDLANVDVSVKQAERVAERVGDQIIVHERATVEDRPCDADTMYLGIDGTGVPVVPGESEGRSGKQADGGSKTREMKLVVGFTAERRDDEGRAQTDPGSVSYNAAIESASAKDTDRQPSLFTQRVGREARRRGFYDAKRQVVLGDGALWIWNLSAELFPGAIEIVDIWHAKEKLHEAGKAIYGFDSDLARPWADRRCDELDEGDVERVITALQAHAPNCQTASQTVGYFSKNRQRMRYREFRQQGLCVSSGVVEAGCKDAIGARQKQSGMRWTVGGANSIAALRCYVKSDRFDDFWYDRSVKHMANEII